MTLVASHIAIAVAVDAADVDHTAVDHHYAVWAEAWAAYAGADRSAPVLALVLVLDLAHVLVPVHRILAVRLRKIGQASMSIEAASA